MDEVKKPDRAITCLRVLLLTVQLAAMAPPVQAQGLLDAILLRSRDQQARPAPEDVGDGPKPAPTEAQPQAQTPPRVVRKKIAAPKNPPLPPPRPWGDSDAPDAVQMAQAAPQPDERTEQAVAAPSAEEGVAGPGGAGVVTPSIEPSPRLTDPIVPPASVASIAKTAPGSQPVAASDDQAAPSPDPQKQAARDDPPRPAQVDAEATIPEAPADAPMIMASREPDAPTPQLGAVTPPKRDDLQQNQSIVLVVGTGVQSAADLKGRRIAGDGNDAVWSALRNIVTGAFVPVKIEDGSRLGRLVKGEVDAVVVGLGPTLPDSDVKAAAIGPYKVLQFPIVRATSR